MPEHVQTNARPQPLVSIDALGAWRVQRAGAPLSLRARKAQALLAILAFGREAMVDRRRLAALLWPDADPVNARASLRQALRSLRTALGDGAATEPEEGFLALADGAVETDLDRALAAARDGRAGAPELSGLDRLDRLLAEFEELGPAFCAWRDEVRRRWAEALRSALRSGWTAPGAAAQTRAALAGAALALDPFDEEALRAAMQAEADRDRAPAALRLYADFHDRVDEEIGAEPAHETQELAARIKLGQGAASAPGQAPASAAAEGREAPRPPARTAAGPAPAAAANLAVAVLPFEGRGPETPPDWAVLGLLEETTAILARQSLLGVISSNTMRGYQGAGAHPAEVSAACNARYVIAGALRLSGALVQLTVEIIDAASDRVVHSAVLQREAAEFLGLGAEVARAIVGTAAPGLDAAELRRTAHLELDALEPLHLVLRARSLVFELDRDAYFAAGTLLQKAARRAPYLAQVHALEAEWRSIGIWQGWSENPREDEAELERAARRAISLAPDDGRAMALLGHNHVILARRYAEAERLFSRALDLLPGDSETLILTAPGLAFTGRAAEAAQNAELALSSSPHDPFQARNQHFAGIAQYAAGAYDRAADLGLASFAAAPDYASNLRMTLASLAAAGRKDDRAELLARHAALSPDFRVGAHIDRQAFRDPKVREAYGADLIRSGLPA